MYSSSRLYEGLSLLKCCYRHFPFFPDILIDDLTDSMRHANNGHNSRYYDVYENKTFVHEKSSRPTTPSLAARIPERAKSETKNCYESYEAKKSESRQFLGSSGSIDERSSPHRDYLYEKYGKYGGTSQMRMPKRSTLEEGWYQSISKEMGHPRSPSPARRNFGSRNTLNVPENKAIGRPLSALSRSSGSAYSSRAASPILRHGSRSNSPKNVVIGPVTEMVERREMHTRGQQEYFRGRDSRQGKVG